MEEIKFPSFAIGIPTLNRWDLLRPTVYHYLTDFPNTVIHILDNGEQEKDVNNARVILSEPPGGKNIGVSASWNILCTEIFSAGHEFALILNDDIYLKKTEYEIGNYLYYQRGALFCTLKDWCAFAIPKRTFETVGPFDEKFFAYYGDNDYERRMKLAGGGLVRVPWLSPFIYRDNSTGEKDPSIYDHAKVDKFFYREKWGGVPGGEKYLEPFNGK